MFYTTMTSWLPMQSRQQLFLLIQSPPQNCTHSSLMPPWLIAATHVPNNSILWESVTLCVSLLGLLQTSTTLPSMYNNVVVVFTETLKLVPRKTFLWLVPIIPILKEWQLFLKVISLNLWAICLLP